MSSGKQYGLQIPKKNVQNLVQKHSAFGDDSSSDQSDGGGNDWQKKSKRDPTQAVAKRQTKLDMQRALEQDATVYQYDEVYEQLEQQKQSKVVKEKERKPRYIQKLLATAEKRKIENERRIERQVQKERDAEGEEFKDKETFVTTAYKKKLEEFAKLDAEQQRQDMLEEIGDVTKQQDISGFYRHLYQTTVSPKEEGHSFTEKAHSHDSKNEKDHAKDKRQYRKRKDSGSSPDRDKDADTDDATSSSSSSSESVSDYDKNSEPECEEPKRIKLNEHEKVDLVQHEKQPPVEVDQPTTIRIEKPHVNIWEKRTVGPVFEAALKRYLERKVARVAAVH
ncbi:nuclear speckle splicing regulatory protein 1 [Cimex lectularius]|uniref:Nuclear speckle splicing regulatory protein 1 N-terminal domain-containing protein n=1 Tax=Cimex lectularius TaxID=79782 RepID=A0A8I6S976_CIMLE|nr:nuclear speckle splicing regulatory protein 1 [Cimex lectularius]